jgi:hypothetical protein
MWINSLFMGHVIWNTSNAIFVADKIAVSDGGFRIKFYFAHILKGAKRLLEKYSEFYGQQV